MSVRRWTHWHESAIDDSLRQAFGGVGGGRTVEGSEVCALEYPIDGRATGARCRGLDVGPEPPAREQHAAETSAWVNGSDTQHRARSILHSNIWFLLSSAASYYHWATHPQSEFSSDDYSQHSVARCEKRHSFFEFPYVCPEPVLVK